MVLRRAILLTTALAYLLVGLTPASGLVLCLGEGGHVTVEPGSSGRCAGTGDAAGGPVVSDPIASVGDYCGDCVDIPFGADGSTHYKRIRHRPVKFAGPLADSHLSSASLARSEGRRLSEHLQFANNPAVDRLRTVILLT